MRGPGRRQPFGGDHGGPLWAGRELAGQFEVGYSSRTDFPRMGALRPGINCNEIGS